MTSLCDITKGMLREVFMLAVAFWKAKRRSRMKPASPLLLRQALQSDGLAAEEELCRLRSQAELHRMQTTVIATLEGERAALERERDTLRTTVDSMRSAQRKVWERAHAHKGNTGCRCSA